MNQLHSVLSVAKVAAARLIKTAVVVVTNVGDVTCAISDVTIAIRDVIVSLRICEQRAVVVQVYDFLRFRHVGNLIEIIISSLSATASICK